MTSRFCKLELPENVDGCRLSPVQPSAHSRVNRGIPRSSRKTRHTKEVPHRSCRVVSHDVVISVLADISGPNLQIPSFRERPLTLVYTDARINEATITNWHMDGPVPAFEIHWDDGTKRRMNTNEAMALGEGKLLYACLSFIKHVVENHERTQ